MRDNKVIMVKLEDGASLPEYANFKDSGMDVRAIEDLVIQPSKRGIIRTGLYFQIPYGYEIQVRSRSGLAFKHGIHVLNSPGTIDAGYRGEVKVILQNSGEEDFVVNKGDRIAQLVVAKVEYLDLEVADDLSETQRGDGGFGSTGVK